MESISVTHALNYHNLYIPNSIRNLIKNSTKEINFVFLPEDTTRSAAYHHNTCFNIEENNVRSTIKTIIWITIAIAAPILLGR